MQYLQARQLVGRVYGAQEQVQPGQPHSVEVKVNAVYAALKHAVKEGGKPSIIFSVKVGLPAIPVAVLLVRQVPAFELLDCAHKEGA